MSKRKAIRFSRYVTKEELAPFHEKLVEILDSKGGIHDKDEHKAISRIISDILQENGDPRHVIVDRHDDDFSKSLQRTHASDYMPQSYKANPNQNIKISVVDFNNLAAKKNKVKKSEIKTKEPMVKIATDLGHPFFYYQTFMSPKEAHDWIHTFPEGPPNELKEHLEYNFPELKQPSEKSNPEKMKRKATKYSRYVSEDEVRDFMNRFKQDGRSILDHADEENKSEEIGNLRRQYYQIMADYFEDHGDPRSELLRGDEPHVSNRKFNTIGYDLRKLGHKHLGFDKDTYEPFMTLAAYQPKSDPKSPGMVRVTSMIVKDAGRHSSMMDPESAYGMAKSLPDDNHRAEAMEFLEQHFPHLKKNHPEKMKRGKAIKYGRLATKPEYQAFHNSIHESHDNASSFNEKMESLNNHEMILSDFLQDIGDPRYKILKPSKDLKTIDEDEEKQLEPYTVASMYGDHYDMHLFRNRKGGHIVGIDSEVNPRSRLKYVPAEEAYDWIHEFPDGPDEKAKSFLEKHFPHLKDNQPEKMNRRKRSKSKFARWVKDKELNQFDHNDDVGRMVLSDYLQEQGDPRHIFFNPNTRSSIEDNIFYLQTHQWNPSGANATVFLPGKNKLKLPIISLHTMKPDPRMIIDDETKSDPRFTTDPIVFASYLTGGIKDIRHTAKLSPEEAHDWIHSLPGGPSKELKDYLEGHFPHLKQPKGGDQPEKMKRKDSRWKTRYQKAIAHYSGKSVKSSRIKKEKRGRKMKFSRIVDMDEILKFKSDSPAGRAALADYLQEQGDPRHIFYSTDPKQFKKDRAFYLSTHEPYLPDFYKKRLLWMHGSPEETGKSAFMLMHLLRPDWRVTPNDKTKSDPRFTKSPLVQFQYGHHILGKEFEDSKYMTPEEAHSLVSSIPDGKGQEFASILEDEFPHLKPNESN